MKTALQRLIAALLLISAAAHGRPASAQSPAASPCPPAAAPRQPPPTQPVTIEDLRAISLDSLGGPLPTYYSCGYRERAEALQRRYRQGLAFYADTLHRPFDVRLTVLTEADGNALDPRHAYGFPWYIHRGPVPVLVMPATTDHGFVVDLFRPRFGDAVARQRLEQVGFHELGHAIVQQYLYPGDSLRTPPVHWFDEMMATYVGQGYLWLTNPEMLAQLRARGPGERPTGDAPPPLTSLPQFEANYEGMENRNYAWYQGTLAARAAAVFGERGLGFLRQMKVTLPWDRFHEWTSDDLLAWLEGIEPGFEAWAASLEQ